MDWLSKTGNGSAPERQPIPTLPSMPTFPEWTTRTSEGLPSTRLDGREPVSTVPYFFSGDEDDLEDKDLPSSVTEDGELPAEDQGFIGPPSASAVGENNSLVTDDDTAETIEACHTLSARNSPPQLLLSHVPGSQGQQQPTGPKQQQPTPPQEETPAPNPLFPVPQSVNQQHLSFRGPNVTFNPSIDERIQAVLQDAPTQTLQTVTAQTGETTVPHTFTMPPCRSNAQLHRRVRPKLEDLVAPQLRYQLHQRYQRLDAVRPGLLDEGTTPRLQSQTKYEPQVPHGVLRQKRAPESPPEGSRQSKRPRIDDATLSKLSKKQTATIFRAVNRRDAKIDTLETIVDELTRENHLLRTHLSDLENMEKDYRVVKNDLAAIQLRLQCAGLQPVGTRQFQRPEWKGMNI